MNTPPNWIETEATVTACRYQSPGLSPLAFGFQTGEKFRITFSYYAHGGPYSDEFQSPVAIPQNEHIAVSYNPLNPQENSRTHNSTDSSTRSAVIGFGIAGSIVLSLIWLLVLRGCR